jgi:ABC-type ATPase with predicted acetyltransferase domain
MKVGTLEKLPGNRPLVEIFGKKDLKRAIYLLNMAGLSEAYLYLKKFDELSSGQQYRAMIAKMIDSERNVWIADEFCSTLDAPTAFTVAHNLRKLSRKFGSTVIVSAPHCTNFIDALQPDQVVYLMSGREYRLFDGPEFSRYLSKKSRNGRAL